MSEIRPITESLGPEMDAWLADRARRRATIPQLAVYEELAIWRTVLEVELGRLRPPLNWMNCLADILNGRHVPVGIANDTSLIFHDACDALRAAREWDEMFDDASTYGRKWELDEDAFLAWLSMLGPAADHALSDAVSRWWKSQQARTVEGWAAVGVTVTAEVGPEEEPEPVDTSGGETLSESKLDELADEAERGYDLDQLTQRRPRGSAARLAGRRPIASDVGGEQQFMATVNVIDGIIMVDAPGEDSNFATIGDRVLSTQQFVEPWNEDETGMERADEVLAAMGWSRVDDWKQGVDGAYRGCTVTPRAAG